MSSLSGFFQTCVVGVSVSVKHLGKEYIALKCNHLKNGTLDITDEDVATAFENFKENLTEEIKEVLEKDKDLLVKAMEDALKDIAGNITEAIIEAGDDQLALIKKKGDEVMDELANVATAVKSLIPNTTVDTEPCEHSGLTGDGNTSRINKTLLKIQAWLIEQYQAMCVAPVTMLNTDIDVPLELIYVAPSIKELKRSHDTDKTSQVGIDVSDYNGLLLREGKPVNTIYIQGDPGCGKTTFSTKLVLDWCKAHSKTVASKEDTSSETTSEDPPKQTAFGDLETLRDYAFLFFVSLRDYSGSVCNVSQMIEDAIKSNKLSWDDRIWEQKCIVLTDAADEWYHPDTPFPSPSDSACKCRKDRSMPQYLKRTNITNIITARPWKLADLTISDTLTRLLEIYGVLDYRTLAKNVFRVLAEKDSTSAKDQEAKSTDFFNKIRIRGIENKIIAIPAMCVQFVHQFYVGRLMEGSLCAIYSNMLDMHIARGLQKLQIKEFDTAENICGDIPHILRTETTEYLQGNLSLVCSASKLAFTMLTDTTKQSSLVIPENKIKKHITERELDYLLQTGIITKKKSLAISPRKNVPYMFVHKTIQEFLASLYIAMNKTEMDAILPAVQLTYCDGSSIFDITQLFIFTCGTCPLAAERMSKHIADVMTDDIESKIQDDSYQLLFLSTMLYKARDIVLDGYIEGEQNKQPLLHLTFSHIMYSYWYELPFHRKNAFKTLIDMNISNIVSIDASHETLSSYRLPEVISQSREALSYLTLLGKVYRRSDRPLLDCVDLQGIQLKFLRCQTADVDNADCSKMVKCALFSAKPATHSVLFKAMSATGENIKFLTIAGCESIDLLYAALSNLRSLYKLELNHATIANTPLHEYLPESIRQVVYGEVSVSSQVIRSMVNWSKSRDVYVKLLNCFYKYLSADEMNVFDFIKQHDDIKIKEINNRCISWSNR